MYPCCRAAPSGTLLYYSVQQHFKCSPYTTAVCVVCPAVRMFCADDGWLRHAQLGSVPALIIRLTSTIQKKYNNRSNGLGSLAADCGGVTAGTEKHSSTHSTAHTAHTARHSTAQRPPVYARSFVLSERRHTLPFLWLGATDYFTVCALAVAVHVSYTHSTTRGSI